MTTPIVRHGFAGTRTIVRFNRPKYALVAGLVVAATLAGRAGAAAVIVLPVSIAAGAGVFWSLTSLVATWLAYDRGDLYGRIGAGLGPVGAWLLVHAGFDDSEASVAAAAGHGPTAVVALDPPARRGLRHARTEHVGRATVASTTRLPVPTASIDTVFVSLAVHEVRAVADQRALFAELRRVLAPGGRLVIAEHLRDGPNAAAYGPAAFHFQTGGTWRRRAAEQGFVGLRDERITPLVQRMVWRRRDEPPRPARRAADQAIAARASASSSA